MGPFLGSFGEDWCVRPAQLGPPDKVTQAQAEWLIVPGPPLSCYLAYMWPRPDVTPMTFYHMHPSTWSVHIVLSGSGRHFADDKEHAIGPGSVIYQGPGVRHSLMPEPNQHLMQVAIQHPAVGYNENEWVVCPEAGTTDKFRDRAAFLERFGEESGENLITQLMRPIMMSERYKELVKKRPGR